MINNTNQADDYYHRIMIHDDITCQMTYHNMMEQHKIVKCGIRMARDGTLSNRRITRPEKITLGEALYSE